MARHQEDRRIDRGGKDQLPEELPITHGDTGAQQTVFGGTAPCVLTGGQQVSKSFA